MPQRLLGLVDGLSDAAQHEPRQSGMEPVLNKADLVLELQRLLRLADRLSNTANEDPQPMTEKQLHYIAERACS